MHVQDPYGVTRSRADDLAAFAPARAREQRRKVMEVGLDGLSLGQGARSREFEQTRGVDVDGGDRTEHKRRQGGLLDIVHHLVEGRMDLRGLATAWPNETVARSGLKDMRIIFY